jgi:AraC-like DNA-binding protein
MSETIVKLLGDWMVESDEHGAGRAMKHDMLLRRMLKRLDDHLTDPSYSSTRLAEEMGISRRYVDTIFADANSTFGKTLLEKRLDRCRALFCDPRTNHRSVTDIAFESGFNDLSHFSKRFREKFGIAPRLARQEARPTLN